jgi:hypothetical protein
VTNVVNLTTSRTAKAAERKENLVSLMDFEYTDTGFVDENGEGYQATPEAQLTFWEYCAAFGFDARQYPSPDERFALWHALGRELAGYVKLYHVHFETYAIVSRRRSETWREYVEAVATGNRERAKTLRYQVVDMSWERKNRP